MTATDTRPIVLITGAIGNLGRSLAGALGRDYRIVGLDRRAKGAELPVFEADFTSDASVDLALHKFRDTFGSRIASVIHLVAYFDFSGKDHPAYQSVNVDGTRRLLRALQHFDVGSSCTRAPCSCTRHAIPANASTSSKRSTHAGRTRNRRPPQKQ